MRRFDPNVPLFLQVKEDIENLILSGAVKENEKLPSVREMARDYQLNPNTVNSAISELLNEEIIYKKRGIGMFVQQGVQEVLKQKRTERFEKEELQRVVDHAQMLRLSEQELIELLKRIYRRKHD
jgi:DNA-binding transcriptional regulator YhcF (GntR family)